MARSPSAPARVLVEWLTEALRGRLGPGWRVVVKDRESTAIVAAPDGGRATIAIEARTTPTTRTVTEVADRASRLRVDGARRPTPFLVAPYIGPRVRAACRTRGVGYADQSGAWSLRLDRPAIDWDLPGADENPVPPPRGIRTLRGVSTARVLRALVERRPPLSLGTLATIAGVTSATAYKVLVLLEREGVVEREPRGAVVAVDWRGVLERWARDHLVDRPGTAQRWLAPRGVETVLDALRGLPRGAKGKVPRVAVTGAWAARAEFDTLVGARLVAYTDRPAALAARLELRPMPGPGSNVTLIVPRDLRLLEAPLRLGGLPCAPWSQIAVDLLGGTDREPAAGENLLGWMEVNEARWRSAVGGVGGGT